MNRPTTERLAEAMQHQLVMELDEMCEQHNVHPSAIVTAVEVLDEMCARRNVQPSAVVAAARVLDVLDCAREFAAEAA